MALTPIASSSVLEARARAVTLDPNEGRKAAVTCMEYGQLYVMEKEDLIAFTKTVPRLRLLSWGGVCFE